jgi:hypothetical protein
VMLKAHANVNVVEELFPEAAASSIHLHDYAASDFEGGKQTEDLEVGIT